MDLGIYIHLWYATFTAWSRELSYSLWFCSRSRGVLLAHLAMVLPGCRIVVWFEESLTYCSKVNVGKKSYRLPHYSALGEYYQKFLRFEHTLLKLPSTRSSIWLHTRFYQWWIRFFRMVQWCHNSNSTRFYGLGSSEWLKKLVNVIIRPLIPNIDIVGLHYMYHT